MARKKSNGAFIALASLGLTALAFVGGMLWNGFHIAEQVATKPYVDDRFTEGKHYTDEKSAEVLKEAFEHSDANRQTMLLEMEQMKTEIKTEQTATSTKVDLVLNTVQSMRDEAWKEAQHRRK